MTKLRVWIYDHKTLGKDKMLGQGEVDVCLHVLVWYDFSDCQTCSDLAAHTSWPIDGC